MFHIYNIFLVISFIGYSLSNDIQKYYPNRTVVSSRSIYDLVQVRRAAARFAAYRNRTHRYNNTNSLYRLTNKILNKNTHVPAREISDYKARHQEFVIKRLKIVIIISIISVTGMIIIVTFCIIARYYQDRNPKFIQRKPQKCGNTKFSQINNDKRNFSRKPRSIPTAV